MDLNIGTAFWFASRGEGYLRRYSAQDYEEMYQFEENGRPLLRLGEEGARKGKGQRTEQAKSLNDGKKIFCSRERCRKVSKQGCPYTLCRTCCEKLQNENLTTSEDSEPVNVCPVHRRTRNSSQTNDNIDHSPSMSAEGTEQIHSAQSYPSYRSQCKILLVGIGADEQMAGYGRHRTTFEKFGWHGLVNELHSDMTRLWTRNLGRLIDSNRKYNYYF